MIRLPRFSRPVAVALLSILLPAACASDNVDMDHGKDITGPAIAGGASLSGNYLSGRHAQAVRDMPEAVKFLNKSIALSPGIPDLVRRAFVLLASEGRIDEAVPLARKIMAGNAVTPIASLTVVVDDIQKGLFDKAATTIATLPEGGLNGFMAPLLGAWTSIARGQSADQATAFLEPLLKDGSKPFYYLHKAMVLDFKGDSEGALKAYEDEIKEQGGISLRVIQLLGNLYSRMGENDKAELLYRNFSKTNPNSPIARHALRQLKSGAAVQPIIGTAREGAAEGFFGIATTLSQQNARETALIFARLGLHLRPDFPVMQILLGNILQLDDQLESANAVYNAIDRNSPYSWPARLRAAENQDDLKRTQEAIDALNALAEEEPALAEPLTRLGDTLRSHERFEEAVLAYDRAFERIGTLERHHWSLLYARGIVLERSKQWDRAEADFLKALEFEPEQPFVLNYLGYSWVDQGKNLDKAKDMIRRAVDLRPSDGYIIDSLGWA
ncbi:MAG: tetratricopeptide repeat protein, partial [Rhodospirillales bacterium]|nr:tetratricopeptide repeat protein [Rhodospirillales bacterium]